MSTDSDDSDNQILTDSERESIEWLANDDDPELARIGEFLLQSFEAREETR
ncbi:hypothetical protein SAMN05216226_102125 [Halovenus aranensis]|uniref:MarR family transcriptional regulator n=1 Tax=Halovenus aranensis TaxID=890420 RepID=A0A1G8SUA2_9EURY|nr:hypothetical protein [Halovenus aranensis]SDJ32160.1 hypothetical protein SAMN05216226_102125 [Halovenus aranensis]